MPVYAANLIPDVTGRQLGQPGQLWDIYCRNINFSGTLTGATQQAFNIFKNETVTFGGISAADSLNVPINHFAGPTEIGYFERYYQRGSQLNPALDITTYGELKSYGIGFAPNILSAWRTGEAQPEFAITFNATGPYACWGSGSAGLDVGIGRSAANWLQLSNLAGGYASLDLLFAHFRAASGPPFQVDSNAQIPNLNASLLAGSDWTNPPAFGANTNPDIHGGQYYVGKWINFLIPTGTPPMYVASTTPVANLTVQHVSDVTFHSTVNSNGDGAKFSRTNLPSMAPGLSIVHVNFTTAFPDSGYTIVAMIFDPWTSGGSQAVPGLRVIREVGQSAGFTEILVINDDSVAHTGAVLHLFAWRGF